MIAPSIIAQSGKSDSIALETEGLTKRFGGLVATDHVNLQIQSGELHAIIGPNGAGKSTLIGQLAGEIRPDAGQIRLFGDEVTSNSVAQRARKGLARSYQISQLCKDFSALENVLMASLALEDRGDTKPGLWQQMLTPLKSSQHLLDSARTALALVGLGGREDTATGALAHGEQRQLELAIALALNPRILLLDEPLAGMSRTESDVMVQLLLKLKGQYPILLIEHDMEAVFALADRVSVLVYGAIIATGTPEQVRQDPKVRTAYLGEDE